MSQNPSHPEPVRPVTGWLVFGLVLLFTVLALLLETPALAPPESRRTLQLVGWLSLAIYLPLGVFSLTLGARRAYGNPRRPFTPVKSHTVALGAVGASLVLFAVLEAIGPHQTPDLSAFYCSALMLFGICTVVVVALRSRGSPLAPPATAALHIVWAPLVPFGTVLFLWWWLSVRKQELPG